MMFTGKRIIGNIILILVLIGLVTGHVPEFDEGEITYIDNLENTQVFYGEIEKGVPKEFQFQGDSGSDIRLSIITPSKYVLPSILLSGPISDVESADITVKGTVSKDMVFEPFAPSSYYQGATLETVIEKPGTYAIFIQDKENPGKFGLVVGYKEAFSLYEWITVPLMTIRIHQWEGQSIIGILGFFFMTLVLGGIFLQRKDPKYFKGLSNQVLTIASLSYLGGSIITLHQLIIAISRTGLEGAAFITGLLIILPIILSFGILSLSNKDDLSRKNGIRLLIFGLFGYPAWAGMVFGPSLVVMVSLSVLMKESKILFK